MTAKDKSDCLLNPVCRLIGKTRVYLHKKRSNGRHKLPGFIAGKIEYRKASKAVFWYFDHDGELQMATVPCAQLEPAQFELT